MRNSLKISVKQRTEKDQSTYSASLESSKVETAIYNWLKAESEEEPDLAFQEYDHITLYYANISGFIQRKSINLVSYF